ncbi:hypothetical protein [Bradyrhizobium australiense]|uniref:Uncharacterized protein n=1 Tax=Bradyrhizobium australiense TaxID=2721161 RepID=A0A7Y4GSS4_9BRAD|nr:hypothetical protein [Bradyrhizobium australiense]NOJ40913.1 hypothetical protein [Bradyrhizobium australiense]
MQLDSECPAILILLGPNAMIAASKPMGSLCDLDQTKLLHAMGAGVFLDKDGDGEVDGKKPLRLYGFLAQTSERDGGACLR